MYTSRTSRVDKKASSKVMERSNLREYNRVLKLDAANLQVTDDKLDEAIRIVIIGCGPHFKNRYFEVISTLQSKGLVEVVLVVDLTTEEQKTRVFFANNNLAVLNFLFISESYRTNISVEDIVELTQNIKGLENVNQIIISTEPKVHKPYIFWAINNCWDIFVDKPLTAFTSLRCADSLFQDYLEIADQISKKELRCVISCERRDHIGYKFLFNYLKNFIDKYNIPINFIDLHFAGGNWVMPNEFEDRENHPFKYGYGVLLHSGYHYIDLICQLLSFNRILFSYSIDSLDFNVLYNNPCDLLNEINKSFYNKTLNYSAYEQYFCEEQKERYKTFGETDIIISGKIRSISNTYTSFSLKLIENSLSVRSDYNKPLDPYIGTGRIRQENLIIHLGSLCSIHVRSLPYSKLNSIEYPEEDFEINILNNPKLVNEKPVIRMTRQDLNNRNLTSKDSLNIKARQDQLTDFILRKESSSSLESHKESIKFLNNIYAMIKQNHEDIYGRL